MRFSIIIPVYNVADYLEECLESVLSQTFTDFEAICINDGSTDRSQEILDAFADLDSRFIVVSKANGGLSSARNAGLSIARGDIVMFLDSDDVLEPRALAVVNDSFSRHEPDILTFGASVFPEDEAEKHLAECLSPRDAVYDKFSFELLTKENSRPYVWRSAFKRDFLIGNQLSFDQTISFGEDQVFYFEAYPKSHKTVLSSEKLYRYRLARSSSLMNSISNREDKLNKHIRIIEAIFKQWKLDGILSSYERELLLWAIDFTANDLLGSNESIQVQMQKRLYKAMLADRHDNAALMSSGPAARIVKSLKLAYVDKGKALSKIDVIVFYVRYRGLKNCIKRVVLR